MQPEAEQSDLISLAEAAKLTGYHQDYLGSLCRSGKLQGKKMGRNWVVSQQSVLAFAHAADEQARRPLFRELASSALSSPLPISGSLDQSGASGSERAGAGQASTASSYNSTTYNFTTPSAPSTLNPSSSPAPSPLVDFSLRRVAAAVAGVVALVASLAFIVHAWSPKSAEVVAVRTYETNEANNGSDNDHDQQGTAGQKNDKSLSVIPAYEPESSFVQDSGSRVKPGMTEKGQVLGDSTLVPLAGSGTGQASGHTQGSPSSSPASPYNSTTSSTPSTLNPSPSVIDFSRLSISEYELNSLIAQQLTNLASIGLLGVPSNSSNSSNSSSSSVPSAPSLPAPVITYIQPAPSQNFAGASLLSATDLSSKNFTTATANITDTATIKTLSVTDNASVGGNLSVTGDTTVNGDITITGNITGNVIGTINPNFTLGSIPFQGASNLTEDNSNLFWDNTNKRLGVGTSSPAFTLEVATANPIAIATMKDDGLTITDTTSNNAVAAGAGTGLRFRAQTNYGSTTLGSIWAETEGSGVNGSLFFATRGPAGSTAADMVLRADGNLGIGTTTPASRLTVVTSASAADGDGIRLHTLSSTNAANQYISLNDANKALSFWVAPSAGWHANRGMVYGPALDFFADGNSGAGEVRFFTNTPGNWVDTPKVVIDGNGNVGISTTAPLAKLDIRGTTDQYSFQVPSTGSARYVRAQSGLASFSGYNLGLVDLAGTYDSFGTVLTGARLGALNSAAWTSTSSPADMIFLTTPTGSTTATEKMRVTSSGNVGVGTTSPTAKLQVDGESILLNGSYPVFTVKGNNGSGGYGYLEFLNSANNNGMYVIHSSTVGNEGLSIWANSGSCGWCLSTLFYSNGNVRIGNPWGAGGISYVQSSGNIGIGAAAPASMLAVGAGATVGSGYTATTAPTNGLLVQGNVGVGTIAPTAKLHIISTDTTNGQLRVGYDTANYLNVTTSSGGTVFKANGTGIGVGTAFTFYPESIGGAGGWKIASFRDSANTEMASLSSTGTLTSVALSTGGGRILGDSNSLTVNHQIVANTTGGWDPLTVQTAGTTNLIVKNGGNVGVGTTAPVAALDVKSDTALAVRGVTSGAVALEVLYSAGTGSNIVRTNGCSSTLFGFCVGAPANFVSTLQTGNGILLLGGSGATATLNAAQAGGVLAFQTAGVEAMRVSSAGNVGIGTTSPNARLDVSGKLYVTTPGTDGLTNIAGVDSSANEWWSIKNANIGTGYGRGITFSTRDVRDPILLQPSSNGKVGIGMATLPAYLLDVNGTVNAPTYRVSTRGQLGTTSAGGGYGVSPTLSTDDNRDFVLLQPTGGNVGIGTTSPGSPFDLYTTNGSGTVAKINTSSVLFSGNLLQVQNGNLNAFIVDSTRNVGINTVPSYRLDIAESSANSRGVNILQTGGAGTNYGVYASATGAGTANIAGYFSATGATSNYAAIFANGNVGIGTTAPAGLLHVKSASAGLPPTSGALANAFAVFEWGNEGMAFGNHGSSPYGGWIQVQNLSTSASRPLLLQPTQGNVGIGTTAPSAAFEVYGNSASRFKVNGTTGATDVYIGDATGEDFDVHYGAGAPSVFAVNYSNMTLNAWNAAQPYTIGVGSNVSRLAINGSASVPVILQATSGNVGIGTTSPASKFEVSTTSTSGVELARFGNTASGYYGTIGLDGSGFMVLSSPGGSKSLSIGTSGVGVNGAASYPLHVNSGASAGAVIARIAANGGYGVDIGTNGSGDGFVGSTTPNNFIVRTNGTDRITVLNSNGNVGIGSTSPAASLDVAGGINATTGSPAGNRFSGTYGYVSFNTQQSPVSGTRVNSFLQYLPSSFGTIGVVGRDSFNFWLGGDAYGSSLFGTQTVVGSPNLYARARIDADTFTAASAQTITTAATLLIGQAPANGTNVTITNPFALFVNSGNSYFGGNVGIGTTNPTSALDVVGSNLGLLRLHNTGGNPYISLYSTSDTTTRIGYIGKASGTNMYFTNETSGGNIVLGTNAQASAVTILDSGNVGIGTTSPAVLLHVEKSSVSGDVGLGIKNAASNATSNSATLWLNPVGNYTVGTLGSYVRGYNVSNSSGLKFGTYSNALGQLEPMVIDTNGNVGIGTTSPVGSGTTQVTISGNGAAASSNFGSLALRNPNTNTAYTWGSVDFYGGSTVGAQMQGISVAGGTAYGKLAFSVNNNGTLTNNMVLDSGALTVGYGNGTISSQIKVYNSSSNGETVGISLGNPNTSVSSNIALAFESYNLGTYRAKIVGEAAQSNTDYGNMTFYTRNASGMNPVMHLNMSGSVGIGTTSPTYKLDVNGTAGTVGVRVASNTAGDILYYGTGTVTGNINFFDGGISATGSVQGKIYNANSSSSSANAKLSVVTQGANSGDPHIELTVSGVQAWSIGVDNSDADKLKVSAGGAPGVSDYVTVQTDGNVGIGTTSPSSLLHLSGANAVMRLQATAAGNAAAAYLLLTDSAGAGIGYIGDSSGSSQVLELQGSPNTSVQIGSNNSPVIYIPTTGNVGVGASSPQSKFVVNGNTTIGASYIGVTAPTNGLLVEGNVGIGTTSTAAKLEVGGSMRFTSAGTGIYFRDSSNSWDITALTRVADQLRLGGGNQNYVDIYGHTIQVARFGTGGADIYSVGTDTTVLRLNGIAAQTARYLEINSSGGSNGDVLSVLASGNVGIGTTAPGVKFTIAAPKNLPATSGTTQTGIFRTLASDGTGVMDQGQVSGGGSWLQATDSTDLSINYKLLLNPNGGNVGIGTTSPGYKLDVSGTGNFSGALMLDNAGGGLTFRRSTYNDWQLFTANPGSGKGFAVYEGTANAYRIFVAEGGNVGIGTTNPIFPLDVQTTVNSNQSYGYLNSSGLVGTSSGTNAYSIRASGRVLASEFNAVSDSRLKDVQFELSPALSLDLITQLRPVSFTWKDNPTGQPVLGFLAQEVEGVIPNAVSRVATANFADQRELSYNQLVAVAIGSIKELHTQLAQMQQELQAAQADMQGMNSLAVSTPITIAAHLYLSSDSVGQAKILAGSTSVRVTFTKPYEQQPVVTATARGKVIGSYWVQDEDATGFTLYIEQAQTDTVTFNWHAFASPEAKLTVSDGTTQQLVLVLPPQPAPENPLPGEVAGESVGQNENDNEDENGVTQSQNVNEDIPAPPTPPTPTPDS